MERGKGNKVGWVGGGDSSFTFLDPHSVFRGDARKDVKPVSETTLNARGFAARSN